MSGAASRGTRVGAARQDYGAPVAMPPEVARYMPVSPEVVAEPFGYA